MDLNKWLFLSISIYVLELVLYHHIKQKLSEHKGLFKSLLLEQVHQAFGKITAEHLAAYSFFYFSFLLFGHFFPVVYGFIITLQLISLTVDIYFISLIQKDSKNE